jgi:hypothetical protein
MRVDLFLRHAWTRIVNRPANASANSLPSLRVREPLTLPDATGGLHRFPPHPRPTNGIWFAITVMNSTFVDSGRFAM